MKRAICLGGGGPAAGLHIGVLESLAGEEDANGEKIKFDIWALSCIGAWVGVVYNQFDQGPRSRAEQTYEFFRDNVFRDDESFKAFPVNTIFGTDWAGNAEAMTDFLLEPENYRSLFMPRKIMKSYLRTMSLLDDYRRGKREFDEGNFNAWVLNDVMAVNPLVRFWTSLIYKSNINGLSRIYYPDSDFMRKINFKKLYDPKAPSIIYNAWNLTKQELQLFCNDRKAPSKADRRQFYKDITPASLCACSALPYVEQTIEIDGDTYCEGAIKDTVNFESLDQDHQDLGEIWISRIVDADQIRPQKNLHDALANLCQLFAATVGEDDVELFKRDVRGDVKSAPADQPEAAIIKKYLQKYDYRFKGTIVEIQVDSQINFEWSHGNLDKARERGRKAAEEAYTLYEMYKDRKEDGKVLIIPDDLSEDDIKAAGIPLPRDRPGGSRS